MAPFGVEVQVFIKVLKRSKQEMPIFPVVLLQNPNQLYYEFIQKKITGWFNGASGRF